MRMKLRGILRCATVSTFQTTPIVGCKQKCGLDLSLLLSVSYVWSDDTGYDCAGPPTGVAVCCRLLWGEMATSSGGNLNRLEATTRVVQPGSVRSCWASYLKKNVLLVTFILN